MTQKERYAAAKEMYAKVGVDTDAAIEKLKKISKDNNIDFYISISATNEQIGDVNMEGCQILN